jgi:hypothetical protein
MPFRQKLTMCRQITKEVGPARLMDELGCPFSEERMACL